VISGKCFKIGILSLKEYATATSTTAITYGGADVGTQQRVHGAHHDGDEGAVAQHGCVLSDKNNGAFFFFFSGTFFLCSESKHGSTSVRVEQNRENL